MFTIGNYDVVVIKLPCDPYGTPRKGYTTEVPVRPLRLPTVESNDCVLGKDVLTKMVVDRAMNCIIQYQIYLNEMLIAFALNPREYVKQHPIM